MSANIFTQAVCVSLIVLHILQRMRETFSAIMVKRIYTLEFDRSTKVKPAMRRSLENAAANRGVVVATPTTLKSIMLSYLEVRNMS